MKVGVVSDTHGLLRPEVLPALAAAAVTHILHLGDVGDNSILGALEAFAPVTAIRGNIDREGPCSALPETEVIELAGRSIYLLHDLSTLDLDPAAAGFAAVLFGHTHAPTNYLKKGVLYFNPGSCGPRRFKLPISIGVLMINDGRELEAELVTLG